MPARTAEAVTAFDQGLLDPSRGMGQALLKNSSPRHVARIAYAKGCVLPMVLTLVASPLQALDPSARRARQ